MARGRRAGKGRERPETRDARGRAEHGKRCQQLARRGPGRARSSVFVSSPDLLSSICRLERELTAHRRARSPSLEGFPEKQRRRGLQARSYAAPVGARIEVTPHADERLWLRRAVTVLASPREVFARAPRRLRRCGPARSEAVLALILLSGIASVLWTPNYGRLMDDVAYDGLLVAVVAFIGGGIYGAAVYFAGGLILHWAHASRRRHDLPAGAARARLRLSPDRALAVRRVAGAASRSTARTCSAAGG